jgi:hypothetical protein
VCSAADTLLFQGTTEQGSSGEVAVDAALWRVGHAWKEDTHAEERGSEEVVGMEVCGARALGEVGAAVDAGAGQCAGWRWAWRKEALASLLWGSAALELRCALCGAATFVQLPRCEEVEGGGEMARRGELDIGLE